MRTTFVISVFVAAALAGVALASRDGTPPPNTKNKIGVLPGMTQPAPFDHVRRVFFILVFFFFFFFFVWPG